MIPLLIVMAAALPTDTGQGGRSFTKQLVVTGYCNCKICTGKEPNDPAYGKTASGYRASVGTAATDWSVFPKGTVLVVPGYGTAVAYDKGGKIKGERVDLWFATHAEAVKWGRQTLSVRIILYPKTETRP